MTNYLSISFAVKNIIAIATANATTNTTKKLLSVAAFNNIAINTRHITINNMAKLIIIRLYFFFLFVVNLIPPRSPRHFNLNRLSLPKLILPLTLVFYLINIIWGCLIYIIVNPISPKELPRCSPINNRLF